jgi:serine/threonine protein phosphatase PrpC
MIVTVAQARNKREHQEDCARVVRIAAGYVAVIADGMGGHSYGEEASSAAVDAAIRAGLDGQPSFWASENGLEIGARLPDTGVPVSQMVIGSMCQSTPHPRRDPQ